MKRSAHLRARSTKRAAADRATAALRAEVAAMPCLLAGYPGWPPCAGRGTPHHLHKQGQGGPTTRANLVPLCAFHNDRVEDEPYEARMLGLVVCRSITPDEARARRVAAGLAAPYYTHLTDQTTEEP